MAVRNYLKLLKDTRTTYFHAKVVDSGLSIPLLQHEISLLKRFRTARMAESQDPVTRAMLNVPAALRVLVAKQTTLNSTIVATRRGPKGALAHQLHQSVDG